MGIINRPILLDDTGQEMVNQLKRIADGGGGDIDQYLKTVEKDSVHQKITIMDNKGEKTEFNYGGGGDGKQNAYASIRKIKDYTFEAVYADIDYEKAYDFFSSMKPEPNLKAADYPPNGKGGMCSAFFKSGVVGRTYDWLYSNAAEIVVHTPALNGRKAVMGTGLSQELTQDIVESGEYNAMFDVVPFELVDGINEDGLFVASLVMPNDNGITTQTYSWTGEPTALCSLMIPRLLLDNCSSAEEVVNFIHSKYSVFTPMPLIEMGYELHFFIADRYGTYGVLETIAGNLSFNKIDKVTNFCIEGVKFNNDGSVFTPATQNDKENAVDTNFVTIHGSGLERFNLINSELPTVVDEATFVYLLQQLKYTKSYDRGTNPYWYTEFVGDSVHCNTPTSVYDESGGVVDRAISAFGSRDRNNPTTWQTVHGGMYDLEKRTMILVFQEDLDDTRAFEFSYYTKEQVDELIESTTGGAVKYSEPQNLMNSEFNVAMSNLKLNARIDTVYHPEDVFNLMDLNVPYDDKSNTYSFSLPSMVKFEPERRYTISVEIGGEKHLGDGVASSVDVLRLAAKGKFCELQELRIDHGTTAIILAKPFGEEMPNVTIAQLQEEVMEEVVTPIDNRFLEAYGEWQDFSSNIKYKKNWRDLFIEIDGFNTAEISSGDVIGKVPVVSLRPLIPVHAVLASKVGNVALLQFNPDGNIIIFFDEIDTYSGMMTVPLVY